MTSEGKLKIANELIRDMSSELERYNASFKEEMGYRGCNVGETTTDIIVGRAKTYLENYSCEKIINDK